MRSSVIDDDDRLQRRHIGALDLRAAAGDTRDQIREQTQVAAAAARLVGQVGDGADDEDLDAEVGERGADLLRVEARVQRHEDRAELEDRVRERRVLGHVAQAHGHAVPLLDAEVPQRVRDHVGERVQGPVGQRRRGRDGGRREGGARRRRGPRDDGWSVAILRYYGGEVLRYCVLE